MDDYGDHHRRMIPDYGHHQHAQGGGSGDGGNRYHHNPHNAQQQQQQQQQQKNNKVPMEIRPEFGVTVTEESAAAIIKDITVIHSDWKSGKKGPGVELYVPGPKREAVAWQVAHTYFAYDGAEMFVCNICGKDLKLSGTAGAISSHLKRKHPGVKEKMEEVERQNAAKKKRKRTDLPMAGAKSIKLENRKMVPFPRENMGAIPQHSAPLPPLGTPGRKVAAQKTVERKTAAIQSQKQAQIMYLIGEGLPFSQVQSRWLRQLIESTVLAARSGVAATQMEIDEQDARTRVFVASAKLREFLKRRIKDKELCGAANHWTSRQNITYMSFSVQWIEDFQLESAVLAVYVLKDGAMKESILQDFASKMEEWDLGPSIKFTVTDRDGQSNSAFDHVLKKFDGAEHLSCLDKMLNLVAKKAFEGALRIAPGGDYGEVDVQDDGNESEDTDYEDDEEYERKRTAVKAKLLPKVRKLVNHFERSIQASDELMAIAKQLSSGEDPELIIRPLAQDLSTSWWSTQNMLDRLLGLREAVTTYIQRKWVPGAFPKEQRPPRLNEFEWEALEELQFMLRPLRFSQQMLENPNSVTASFVPLVVHLIYQELETVYQEDTNNENVRAIAKEMLNTMDELFGNFATRQSETGTQAPQVKIHKAILLAHSLDPRFKPLSVFPSDVQEQIWADLLEEMLKLGPVMAPQDTLPPEESVSVKEESEDPTSSSKPSGGTGVSTELDSLFQLYANKQKDVVRRKPKDQFDAENWKRKCEIELKQYQETSGMEPKMGPNVLRQWWGEDARASMYPVLWRLAQRFLCINATSSPSQRAFSTASNESIHGRCKMCTSDELHLLHENFDRLEEAGVWDFNDSNTMASADHSSSVVV